MRLSVAVTPFVGMLLLWSGMASADEPLEPPQPHKILAPDSSCWAYFDPVTSSTIAYRRGEGKRKTTTLWKVDGWFRVAALASDCEHFVTGYDGVNLLPDKFDRKTVMLSFHANGKLFRQVTLDELVEDLSKLRKTSSHWAWGSYLGLEQHDRYRIETVDRGQLVFDMKTGAIVE